LRRYWQPIALSSEATTVPRQIRRFGEDLILFRNQKGEAGLLTPRCIHRGATLFYGKVEEDGIRCCYHGWKFSPQGEVLDQPCEPDGGRNKHKLRQPWYPVVEHHGAVWTYMGPPDRQPLFPIFSCFENLADDETVIAIGGPDAPEVVGPALLPHNWYQAFDNATDHYHLPILHTRNSGPQLSSSKFSPDLPEVEWTTSPNGYSILTTARRDLGNGETYVRIEQMLMPNIIGIPSVLTEGPNEIGLLFWIPIDDSNTMAIPLTRYRADPNFNVMAKAFLGEDEASPASDTGAAEAKLLGFGPEKKAWHELTPEEHQLYPGDYEAQVGQGVITLHSEEHLATSDTGLVKQRRLWKQQAKIVAEGGDPAGVAFKEEDRRILVEATCWVEKAADSLAEPALASSD
ncbi:MAG TPA: Rieske 2Fe-2S domain-containing protein, partial [Phenylobacterium sp.]|uniref:Rieske 2Fe-2S domain-containing protein n=1 Tax=Phenylobacterium sp. TaxID=1871053 RepID=UPI002B46FE88